MDVEKWMRKAHESINKRVAVGKKFKLSELFESVEWTELSKGERIQFGKFFANAVKEGEFECVERVEKAPNNHTQYIKKEM